LLHQGRGQDEGDDQKSYMYAIRHRRAYASEDENFELRFMAKTTHPADDWHLMGGEVGLYSDGKFVVALKLNDPDEPIGRVELIGIDETKSYIITSKVCDSHSDKISWTVGPKKNDICILVRVIQKDGNWILSAPIWINHPSTDSVPIPFIVLTIPHASPFTKDDPIGMYSDIEIVFNHNIDLTQDLKKYINVKTLGKVKSIDRKENKIVIKGTWKLHEQIQLSINGNLKDEFGNKLSGYATDHSYTIRVTDLDENIEVAKKRTESYKRGNEQQKTARRALEAFDRINKDLKELERMRSMPFTCELKATYDRIDTNISENTCRKQFINLRETSSIQKGREIHFYFRIQYAFNKFKAPYNICTDIINPINGIRIMNVSTISINEESEDIIGGCDSIFKNTNYHNGVLRLFINGVLVKQKKIYIY